MKNVFLLLVVLILASCTFAKGNIQSGKFTIIDLHPGGEALGLSVEIPGKVKITVSRETESATEAISSVIPVI